VGQEHLIEVSMHFDSHTTTTHKMGGHMATVCIVDTQGWRRGKTTVVAVDFAVLWQGL
jgi:hypothetical protein